MYFMIRIFCFIVILSGAKFAWATEGLDKNDFIEQSGLIQSNLEKRLKKYNSDSKGITLTLDRLEKQTDKQTFIKVEVFDNTKNKIGYIDFTVNEGLPFHVKGDKRVDESKKYIYGDLWKIEIYPGFQGKGYAKDILSFYHEFLISNNIDFFVLGIDSDTRYAGKIYKNAGYDFTQRTKDLIKAWATEQMIPEADAEAKFLEDTSRSLGNQPASMVKFNPSKNISLSLDHTQ